VCFTSICEQEAEGKDSSEIAVDVPEKAEEKKDEDAEVRKCPQVFSSWNSQVESSRHGSILFFVVNVRRP
jgi:hypothetical protein